MSFSLSSGSPRQGVPRQPDLKNVSVRPALYGQHGLFAYKPAGRSSKRGDSDTNSTISTQTLHTDAGNSSDNSHMFKEASRPLLSHVRVVSPVQPRRGESPPPTGAHQFRAGPLREKASPEPLSVEERFRRLEKAQDKLVQATVDAIHHHQTVLDIAEERWAQRIKDVEDALQQQQGFSSKSTGEVEEQLAQKVAALQNAVQEQRLAQGSTSRDVHALRVALQAQEERGDLVSSASAMKDSSADLAVAIRSNVAEQNDQLLAAITELVGKRTNDVGNTGQVSSDMEEVRELVWELVKVSNGLALEFKRLRQQQNCDYDETNGRLDELGVMVGQGGVPDALKRKPADESALTDVMNLINQLNIKKAQRATGLGARPKLEQSRELSKSSPFIDNLPLNGDSKGDVGEVIKLLRARLNTAGVSEAQNPILSSADNSIDTNLTVKDIADYRDRLLRQANERTYVFPFSSGKSAAS